MASSTEVCATFRRAQYTISGMLSPITPGVKNSVLLSAILGEVVPSHLPKRVNYQCGGDLQYNANIANVVPQKATQWGAVHYATNILP